MTSVEDSSYESCLSNDHALSEVIAGYHLAGAKQTSSKDIWDPLVDVCHKVIASKFHTNKRDIFADLDAYSFVISTETMNSMKKTKLREFLQLFGGESFGRCSFPTTILGSKTKDSIFGCCGNRSQHLPPILQGNEMLVIDVPLKIALHHSCQSRLIDYLKLKGFYYSPSSSKTGICFNPSAAANKPPYGVIIEAIINSCEVTTKETGLTKNTHIIHIADMGFRTPLRNNFDGMHKLFKKCQEMKEVGFLVELTQFDVAFVFQAPQDHLIQAKCHIDQALPKDSLFQKSRITVYPIHTVPKFNNGKLKSHDLRGTFEIKKTSWESGCWVNLEEDMPNSCIHLFSSSRVDEQLRDSISIHSSTIHSVKGYSTVAHMLLQKRSRYPMHDKVMYGIGNKKIEHIQTLIANAKLSLKETFGLVKSHGIGFRIEVSIRPHFNDPIRYSRHENDLMLIVSHALKELCGTNFSIQINFFPTRSVETEALKLLSELTSMVTFRKEIVFNQVYVDNKITEWLRSHVSLLMITIGICPEFVIKYINQWLMDDHRFDPNNKVIDTHPRRGLETLSLIQHRMLCSLQSHLKYLKFSDHSVEILLSFLKDAPNIDPLACFSSLSFRAKHLLVACMWTNIIPHLSSFLSQEKNKVTSHKKDNNVYEMTHLSNTHQEDLHDNSDTISDKVLDDLIEHASLPSHPLALAISSLIRMSGIWNLKRQGFNQILFHFIQQCHNTPCMGYDRVKDNKTQDLISKCLTGFKLTRDELRHICMHLIHSCSMQNQTTQSYQTLLCKHYQFPCSEISQTLAGNATLQKEKNLLINSALCQDLSVFARTVKPIF